MKTKYLNRKKAIEMGIQKLPNFSASGSIKGMKEIYYGKDALLVRSGSWIYCCTERPDIYDKAH
jgi:hypothetical protein